MALTHYPFESISDNVADLQNLSTNIVCLLREAIAHLLAMFFVCILVIGEFDCVSTRGIETRDASTSEQLMCFLVALSSLVLWKPDRDVNEDLVCFSVSLVQSLELFIRFRSNAIPIDNSRKPPDWAGIDTDVSCWGVTIRK